MNHLSSLNPKQQEAVKILEGPALVLAGAGSGKTRVVTCRIVYLIENGVAPSQILGVTFTNKAAQEMRERVHGLCHHPVFISTFHSLGMRILRESISRIGYKPGFVIYDEDDVDKVIKLCIAELGLKEKKLDLKGLRQLISRAKNALQGPEEFSETGFFESEIEEYFSRVYALYQNKLQDFEAVDFDDLLYLTVKLWKEHPDVLSRYQAKWPFVLIDEYQDTNAAQYTLTRLLVSKSNNIFVVGDPDQSIYSWRGANVHNILNFEIDYPGARVILLEQNYRSSMHILKAANALINHNSGRYEKELWSELGDGEKIQLFVAGNDREEAVFVASRIEYHHEAGVPFKEMAVFYRTNAQSRVFEDYLIAKRIPYVIIGGLSFYQRREIKDILAYLRVVQSDSDYISFARSINLPKRGLGDVTIEKIRHHADIEALPTLQYCRHLLAGDKSLKTILRLTAKQKEGLSEYIQVIEELREIAKEESLQRLVAEVIDKTRYKEYLQEDKDSCQDRRENLDQLQTKAMEWELSAPEPSLSMFLEELSLKSSMDESIDVVDRLHLMTIHNGKGLEFRVAFLVGLEETLFPHVNSKNSEEEIEEERRLCYVGITRAKQHLYISHTHERFLWGSVRAQYPSRFLKEIPFIHIQKFGLRSKMSPSAVSFISKEEQKPFVMPSNPELSFEVGEWVHHQEFGRGKIEESYMGSMGQTYKIYFESDKRIKTIVAKYATLKRLP